MNKPTTATKNSKMVLLASVCLVVAALKLAQDVFVPLALSILICFLLAPLVRRLERRRLGRVPSVVIVMIVAFGLIGTLGYFVGTQVIDFYNHLPQYKENIAAKIEPIRGWINRAEKMSSSMGSATTQSTQPTTMTAAAPPPETQPGPPSVPAPVREVVGSRAVSEENPLPVSIVQHPSVVDQLESGLGWALGPIGTFGMVLVFAVFMLLQREDLRDRMIRLVGFGDLNVTTQALDDASARISRYLTAQAIVNGSYGVAISIGLFVIGLTVGHGLPWFPSFVLWGLLCGLLRFIPYIGPWIASIFPLAIALAVYKGFGVFLAVGGLFVFIELLSNNLMEPMLYGSSTGMSTVAILVSAVFWTWLWGATGLFMATPLTVCLVVLGKYVPQLAFLDVILGDEPALAPHERIYQRLLAFDQEEAAEIVSGYVDKMPLDEMYDTVLIPALAMAEVDRHRGALDDRRKDFVHQAMRELVEEAYDRRVVNIAKMEAVGAKIDESAPKAPATLPKDCKINIVSLPAHHEADEICGLMLTQVLLLRKFCAFNISQNALASEMMDEIEKHDAHVVVVNALPPEAVTHSRYLCKRLHQRFEGKALLVGLWSTTRDLEKARARIACDASVPIVPTLKAAIHEIEQLAQHLVLQAVAQQPASADH